MRSRREGGGCFAQLDEHGQDAPRSALLRMVTVTDTGAVVRRRAGREDVDAAVVLPLVDTRLVTAGDDSFEIAHQALLTAWPRLAGGGDADRKGMLVRHRLYRAAWSRV